MRDGGDWMSSQGSSISSSSEVIDLDPDVKIHGFSSFAPSSSSSFSLLTRRGYRHLSSLSFYVLNDPQGRKLGINAVLRFFLFAYAFVLSSTLEWLVLAAFCYRSFYDFLVAFSTLIQSGMRGGVFGSSFLFPHAPPEEGGGEGGGMDLIVFLFFSTFLTVLFACLPLLSLFLS